MCSQSKLAECLTDRCFLSLSSPCCLFVLLPPRSLYFHLCLPPLQNPLVLHLFFSLTQSSSLPLSLPLPPFCNPPLSTFGSVPAQIIFSLSNRHPSIHICFPSFHLFGFPSPIYPSNQSSLFASLTPYPLLFPFFFSISFSHIYRSIITLNTSSFSLHPTPFHSTHPSFTQLSVVCAAMLILDALSPLLLLSILLPRYGCRAADIPEDTISEFSVRLYHRLQAAGDQDNIIFSPLSVAVALGMVELGARGASLEEIRQAVGFSHLLPGETHVHTHMVTSIRDSGKSLAKEIIVTKSKGVLHHFTGLMKDAIQLLFWKYWIKNFWGFRDNHNVSPNFKKMQY